VAARGSKAFVHDVGGEGGYPGAVNLNPAEVGAAGKIPNLVRGIGQQLPFKSGVPDLVTAENVPIHLPGLIEEVARVAAAGGTVRLENPADFAPGVLAHQRLIELLDGEATQSVSSEGLLTTLIRSVKG
jgi:hypothetical protein